MRSLKWVRNASRPSSNRNHVVAALKFGEGLFFGQIVINFAICLSCLQVFIPKVWFFIGAAGRSKLDPSVGRHSRDYSSTEKMDILNMSKSEQTGFSLVEVLIAVFVLALGVIGVAGMQLTAIRTSQQSAFQTTAVELATEMGDEMRANEQQMQMPDGSNPFLNVDYQSQSGAPASAHATCYSRAANCSGEELAAFDINEWEQRVKASLPTSRAKICRDGSPWDGDAKSLTWDCDPSSGNIVIKIGWRARNPDGSFAAASGIPFPPIVALTVMPGTR